MITILNAIEIVNNLLKPHLCICLLIDFSLLIEYYLLIWSAFCVCVRAGVVVHYQFSEKHCQTLGTITNHFFNPWPQKTICTAFSKSNNYTWSRRPARHTDELENVIRSQINTVCIQNKLTGIIVNGACSVLNINDPDGFLSFRPVLHLKGKHTSDLLHKLLSVLQTHTHTSQSTSVAQPL